MGLPVEIGSFEVGELGDPESRVKKGPDDELLFGGGASVGQAGQEGVEDGDSQTSTQ